MKPRPTIRLATYRDAVEIQDCLWRCQDETDTPYPDPDEPYATQKLMQQANEGLIAVLVVDAMSHPDDGEIVGVIVLAQTVWPWKHPDSSNARYLINEHFYIRKGFRHGGGAKMLLDWAKDQSDWSGLPLMLDFSTADADMATKDRFARMQGFKHIGGKFLRQSNTFIVDKE